MRQQSQHDKAESCPESTKSMTSTRCTCRDGGMAADENRYRSALVPASLPEACFGDSWPLKQPGSRRPVR